MWGGPEPSERSTLPSLFSPSSTGLPGRSSRNCGPGECGPDDQGCVRGGVSRVSDPQRLTHGRCTVRLEVYFILMPSVVEGTLPSRADGLSFWSSGRGVSPVWTAEGEWYYCLWGHHHDKTNPSRNNFTTKSNGQWSRTYNKRTLRSRMSFLLLVYVTKKVGGQTQQKRNSQGEGRSWWEDWRRIYPGRIGVLIPLLLESFYW